MLGEKPTISYVFTCADREKRRKILREKLYFECNCIMCEKRLDEDVDYGILNELLEIFENADNKRISWPIILNFHSVLYKMLESIYHKYDERVTNQFKRITELGYSHSNAILESPYLPYYVNDIFYDVSALTLETEHRLSITYGVHHSDYKEFMKGLSPDLRSK